MSLEITTERTHLFCPNINVAVLLELGGPVTHGGLEEALQSAAAANGILKTRVRGGQDGRAAFLPHVPVLPLRTADEADWRTLVRAQARIPFDIEGGELMRAFRLPAPEGTRLLLIAHHIAADGLSMVSFAGDVLHALAGEPLPFKPARAQEIPPEGGRLSPVLRLLVRSLAGEWARTGRAFTPDDLRRMSARYWQSRDVRILQAGFDAEALRRLQDTAHAHGVTIGTLIAAALFRASGGRTDIGLAADARPKGLRCMGNHATGISAVYAYDGRKSLGENASRLHCLIRRKLDDPRRKFFLIAFLSSLPPTLIDAAYFAAFDGYDNRAARRLQRLFGYDGNPRGISLSNLGRLDLPTHCGPYALTGFTFAPPLVPNARRVVGVATLGKRMELTLTVEQTDGFAQDEAFFERAVAALRSPE